MKLILRDGNCDIEVKEIAEINKDSETIILFLDCSLRIKDIQEYEESLTKKIGKKVICLDKHFREKIYGI